MCPVLVYLCSLLTLLYKWLRMRRWVICSRSNSIRTMSIYAARWWLKGSCFTRHGALILAKVWAYYYCFWFISCDFNFVANLTFFKFSSGSWNFEEAIEQLKKVQGLAVSSLAIKGKRSSIYIVLIVTELVAAIKWRVLILGFCLVEI